ncbi:MAG TPA: DUF885 domain-containing protein, partial [Chthoniobacteraceae bacterium]|nr:DUF885 domain-containing protein [Chthoniobacteraceae bacterium]
VTRANEDQKLEQFFRGYLEERFRMQPLDATRLGDHRFDHLLDDLSADARREQREFTRSILKRLPKEVDYRKLSRDGQVDFEILTHELETSLWLDENTKPYETNPRLYSEYISDSVFQLLAQSPLPKETNISNAIGRIGEIPKVVRAARENLKNPPPAVLETAIRQNKGSISFYEKDIFEIAGETSQRDRLAKAAGQAVPVLKEYQQFLEGSLLPKSTGEWRLGKRKFEKKLELVLDAGMTAEEVLRDAESEFERVTAAMLTISRQLWFKYYPDKPFPSDSPKGRQQAIQLVMHAVNQEHGKPEELVADARATVERIKSFIQQKKILRLPEPDRCQIIEMPEFQRGNSLAYLNSAPPLDPEAPSLYAISPPAADWDARRTKTLLEEYNAHMLQILTIHEAYPGHYVQLEYSNRAGSLLRRVLQSGVYVEGWAVYTEQTMLDQGYGEGDLRLRLMQLKFYLRAVGNAMLDHHMHAGKMSDDEAFAFLTERAFQSEEEARQKIVRAKQTSVQLSTYFVGRMAMQRLRDEMQAKLGEKFDLGRYHEAVLEQGSVPVKYLRELVGARLAR